MVSLLDCIERVPQTMQNILENRHENFAPLFNALGEKLSAINEIVFVGSGTSNTSAITSRMFVEKVSGLKTTSVYPSDFCHNTFVYNPNALYIFTSQTGTSIIARDAQKLVKAKGFAAFSITESADTPIAKESAIHINMGCGCEEHPTRTIGYCASVFTHMLLGLEIGLRRAAISEAQYNAYITCAEKLPESQKQVIQKTMRWMDTARRQMLRSQCVVFTGADALQGVALEAAVKVWEIPQHIAIGYELEEGLHGANYGYNPNHCVVVLNHGGRENEKALALARWMKEVHKNGLVIGSEVVDDADLALELQAGEFDCLEFAPAIQILAYRMALDEGRDLCAPHDNSVMESYFRTHG